MAGRKKKMTREEKLAADRERKRKEYAEKKQNTEVYAAIKEKERLRYIKRKETSKICSIKNMNARDQREQRRRWRKNSQTYLKKKEEKRKLEQILLDNSPPTSDNENPDEIPAVCVEENVIDPLAINGEQQKISTEQKRKSADRKRQSLLRRSRYRSLKAITQLKNEIATLQKQKEIWRKRALAKKLKKKENTVEKKVNMIVKDIQMGKIEEVKKKLFLCETINKNVTLKYKSLKKRQFAQDIIKDKDQLKEYQVLSKVPFTIRTNVQNVNDQTELEKSIKAFFLEDANSQVAPGKGDSLKIDGQRIQKRYLTDTLKNLHIKYCTDYGQIHYSTFCDNRPKWVIFPEKQRDTCQCKIHANIDLLIMALKKAKITTEGTSAEMVRSITCDAYNANCLERKCKICKNKTMDYKEFDNSQEIQYFVWTTEKQTYIGKDKKQKVKTVTIKKALMDSPKNVINKLEAAIDVFLKHTRNIVSQYSAIKELKNNLTTTEVLIHIDFSENYNLKYSSEVQSFHFGGSRGQVSLHTGVLYYRDSETGLLATRSFCTMSQCLHHDASAIWAHLTPVLEMAQNLVPVINVLHFLSDSPSSQYRNRFIFYMMTQLKEEMPFLDNVTWNYQEAGHGKGAPDGIGAVIKRTADNYVRFGGDVGSFEDFVEVIRQNTQSINMIIISDGEITRQKFPEKVVGFKGTTKVHQAVWSLTLPYSVALRNLSCFICKDSYLPCGHGKHLGVISVGANETASCQTVSIPDQIDSTELLQIDSPTIYNNVGVNMVLNEIDGNMFLEEPSCSQAIPEQPEQRKESSSPKVQILSNVPFDWQRYNFYKKSHKLINPSEQMEFKKFIGMDISESDDISEHEPSISLRTEPDHNKENLYFSLDDWVIVKYDVKNKSKYYIGRIAEKMELTQEYRVDFVKKAQGKTMMFGWPTIKDEDIVSECQIIQKLQEPEKNRRGQYKFNDLPEQIVFK